MAGKDGGNRGFVGWEVWRLGRENQGLVFVFMGCREGRAIEPYGRS